MKKEGSEEKGYKRRLKYAADILKRATDIPKPHCKKHSR